MKTERRALTPEETEQLNDVRVDDGHWNVLLGISATMGGVCGGIVAIVSHSLANYAGLDIAGYIGISHFNIAASVAVVVAVANFVVMLRADINHRKKYKLYQARVRASDDLLVELYEIKDCKLVRDPEHGQPMFFVRCDDGSIHCIFEGQDELDEDWDEHPLQLDDSERPRANLKIVRDPKTKESILEQFSGPAIPVDACYIINVDPDKWPVEGKALRCRWENIDKRYKLEKMDPAGL